MQPVISHIQYQTMDGYQDYQSRGQRQFEKDLRHAQKERERAQRRADRGGNSRSSHIQSSYSFAPSDQWPPPNQSQQSNLDPCYSYYNPGYPKEQPPDPYTTSSHPYSQRPPQYVDPGYPQTLPSQYPPPPGSPYLELEASHSDGTQRRQMYHYESGGMIMHSETTTDAGGQHSSLRQSYSNQSYPLPGQAPRSSRPDPRSHPLGGFDEDDETPPENEYSSLFSELSDIEQAAAWARSRRTRTPDGCIRGEHPDLGGPAFLLYVDRPSRTRDTRSSQGPESFPSSQRAPPPTASGPYGPGMGYTSNASRRDYSHYSAPPESDASIPRGRQRTRFEDQQRRGR